MKPMISPWTIYFASRADAVGILFLIVAVAAFAICLIREWELKHDAEKHGLKTMEQRLRAGGCCGGRYTYQFVPTSIGTIGEVICSCGEKFTFQDL